MAELLWQEHGRPLPDVDAITKSIDSVHRAHAVGEPMPPATDLVAALVVLRAARQDIDRLEVALVEAVRTAGLDWDAIAAGLELPDGDAAEKRYEQLRPRAAAPFDAIDPRARAESGGSAEADSH